MATGDNTKTASSVAIKWGIIETPRYYKIDLIEKRERNPQLKCEEISHQESYYNENSHEDFTEEEDQDTDDENHPLLEENQSSEHSKRMSNLSGPKSSNSGAPSDGGFDEIMDE